MARRKQPRPDWARGTNERGTYDGIAKVVVALVWVLLDWSTTSARHSARRWWVAPFLLRASPRVGYATLLSTCAHSLNLDLAPLEGLHNFPVGTEAGRTRPITVTMKYIYYSSGTTGKNSLALIEQVRLIFFAELAFFFSALTRIWKIQEHSGPKCSFS